MCYFFSLYCDYIIKQTQCFGSSMKMLTKPFLIVLSYLIHLWIVLFTHFTFEYIFNDLKICCVLLEVLKPLKGHSVLSALRLGSFHTQAQPHLMPGGSFPNK